MSEQGKTVEERARDVGWDSNGPKGAEEFLQGRDNHLGIAKADIGKLETKIVGLENTMDSMVKFFEKNQVEATKRGYDMRINEERQKMRDAVDSGNTDEYHAAEQRQTQLVEARDKKVDEGVSIGGEPQDDGNSALIQMVNAHSLKNPAIFASGDQRNAWAEELKFHWMQIRDQGGTLEQAFEKADRAVVKRFALERAAPGQLGGNDVFVPPGGPPEEILEFSQLPTADKEVYNRLKAQFGDTYTQEKYMEQYNV